MTNKITGFLILALLLAQDYIILNRHFVQAIAIIDKEENPLLPIRVLVMLRGSQSRAGIKVALPNIEIVLPEHLGNGNQSQAIPWGHSPSPHHVDLVITSPYGSHWLVRNAFYPQNEHYHGFRDGLVGLVVCENLVEDDVAKGFVRITPRFLGDAVSIFSNRHLRRQHS